MKLKRGRRNGFKGWGGGVICYGLMVRMDTFNYSLSSPKKKRGEDDVLLENT